MTGVQPGDIPVHPAGFTLPRIWTPADPDGSDYRIADRLLAWLDSSSCPLPRPLPWQRMVLREAWATAAGSDPPRWRYSTVVLRVGRQSGKTSLARMLLLALLRWADGLLGEPARILSTHPDGRQAVGLCVPVAHQLGYGARHGNRPGLSAEHVSAEWFPWGVAADDEPVWMARAMTLAALTGQKGINVAFIDELQDVKPQAVSEALGGAMSSALIRNRMRVYAGTGARPESEYLRRMQLTVLGSPGVLWAEWSVPPGADEDDERVWRWGSPDWTPSRLEWLRQERAAMHVDEFRRNYLLNDDVTEQAPRLLDPAVWAGCGRPGLQVPQRRCVVGVGRDPDGAWPVVLAGQLPDGSVGVRSLGVHPVLEEAQDAASQAAGAGAVLVAPAHPLKRQVQVRRARTSMWFSDTEAAAAADLAVTWVGAGRLLHDPEDSVLTAEVLALPKRRRPRECTLGSLALVAAWFAARPSAPGAGVA